MVIVSVTRDDLRDESIMADEAFALSPISARAAQPNEEDYDAISAAFMETSRGRWFLGEYAKRNRNADTRMVLDAVARIEDSIAAQRQPPPDSGLAEVLATIRNAVDQAEAAATLAVENIAPEESLAPIRKGARVIREISWRWREIGADARICDLLDSQVSAIEGACGQISSASPQAALIEAFNIIKAQIPGFAGDDAASPQPAAAASSPAASYEMPAPAGTAVQQTSATSRAVAAIGIPPMPVEAAVMDEAADKAVEDADATADAVDVRVEAQQETAKAAVDVKAEAPEETAEAADAHDEAVLDLIALEMAAPDPDDIDDAPATDGYEIHAAELAPAEPAMLSPPEPIIVAERSEPRPEPRSVAAPAVQPPLEPLHEPSHQPSHEPSHQPSLGSTLIANGILRSRHASESDPLAPIRRLSQIEKIAFFS
jgi:hypothetical protein